MVLVNYFTCALIGLVFLVRNSEGIQFPGPELLALIVLWGLLFISMFSALAYVTSQWGVATGSLSSRLSLIIPFVYFSALSGEVPGLLSLVGVILAISSVVVNSLSAKTKNSGGPTDRWLVPAVFLGFGAVDIVLHYLNEFAGELPFSVLTGALFFVAGIAGLAYQLIRYRRLPSLENTKMGLVLGLVNFIAIFVFFYALQSLDIPRNKLFAINAIAILLTSNLLALVIWPQKLPRTKIIALILGLLAIIALI